MNNLYTLGEHINESEDLKYGVAMRYLKNFGKEPWGERKSFGHERDTAGGGQILYSIKAAMVKKAGLDLDDIFMDDPSFDGRAITDARGTVAKLPDGITLAKVGALYIGQVKKAIKKASAKKDESVNEGGGYTKVQDELEGLIKDMSKEAYDAFAGEYDMDPEDAAEMMGFITDIPDKDAKRVIKDIKKGLYESVNERNPNTPVKIGDILYLDGRKGKVVKVMQDMANVDFGKGDVYGINFNRIEGDTIGESVNEMNVGHAEVMRLERILSSKNKKALVKALDDGTIKTSKDLAKWVKTIKESVNEGLSNYSLLDFFKEMQSFPAAGVDAKDIKGASQPHNKKKTVKNTPALQSLLDEWKSGRYDEDPGTLVDELRHLLKTDTKDVRAGFSSSDINNLDDVADDVSDVFSNKGTLKMHIPYQKWVKMDDDEKAWNVEQALYKLTKSNAVKKLLSKKEDDVIAYVVKVLSESVNEASVKFNNIKTFNESVNEAKKYDWDDILDVLMQSTAVGGAGKVIDRINAKDPEVKELLAGRYKSFPDFAKAVQSIYNLEESINEGTVKISGTLRFFDQFLTDMANIGMYDGDFEEDVKRGYTEYSEDVWDNIKTKNAVARLVHKYHAEITESVNEAEIGGYYLMKQLKDMSDDMKRDEPKAAAALMYLYDRINQSARDIDLNADDIDDFLREPRGRKHSLNLPDWMIHDLFVESFILQEDGATNMPQADPPIPLTPEQKKKKKEEEDEEAEEMAANDAADGAGPPKQGGFAKAAAKQMQSYMEKIDSFDGFVNEGEILVWDELEKPFADLKNALDKITKENTDPKWSKALLSIWKQIEKAEHNLGVYDRNLGVITTESADVTSIAYALKNKGKVRPNDETIKFHIDSYKVDDDPYDVAKEIGDYYNWTEREIEKAEKIIRKKYLR